MKRIKAMLLCLAVLVATGLFLTRAAAADAGAYRRGPFSYRITDDGTAEITRVYFEEGQTSLDVPAQIDGYQVTALGYYAMGNYTALESVTLPDTMTTIGNGAFSLCRSLEEITLPDSLEKIDTAAFFGCEALKTIAIPARVKTIGNTAFRQCRSLRHVTIPDSVVSVGKMAFFECDALRFVTVPSTVTSIGENAFGYTLSDGVTPLDGFAVLCEEDTAAHAYAVENGFWRGTDGYICGDADGNGIVDLKDATAVQIRFAGLPTPSFDERAADIDGNGAGITDATWIQRYAAAMQLPYPIGDFCRNHAQSIA